MKETLTERDTSRGRHLFGGALHIFASEALLVPAGLLTAAYLSRRFGPEGYGLLTLAFAPVVLLESNVATALSRPAIKLVGGAGASEWERVGAAVLRLYVLTGCALSVALLLAAALLSTLARALREGDDEGALALARLALRAVVLLLPVASATAGAALEIVALIFGREYEASSALLRPLIFGSLALLMVSVAASVLAAAGRERWTVHAAWPTLACAALGHALVIPYAGARGAAAVTALTACACALVSLALVWRAWRVAPTARTLASSAAVAACAYALTALVPSAGLMLALKLACACALSAAALAALGEFGARRTLRPLHA